MGDTRSNQNHVEVILRWPNPGEWGWIMQEHGRLYWAEYGFPSGFERLVGEIICEFMAIKDTSPRSRAWIAAIGGQPVGSIFLHEHSQEVGRLRLFLINPEARGFGVGTKLLEACIEFAKANGYKKITLWTQEVLKNARRLYDKAGFKVVHTENHTIFGIELIGQTLELDL